MVNDKLETLEREFETHCHTELEGTLERHPDLFSEAALQRILTPPSITGKLGRLFRHAGDHDIPLYVLIDEYDNFANTVLAHHGAEAYHSFTQGGSFFRSFFATLKGGADRSGGGIERLFITGVSPVTMDDVTSGFNIGTNISLHPDFNEMVGFTEAEVRHLVETYRERDVFDQDVDTAMGIMGQWYNGYRFATAAETDLYNSTMVLYYLKHSIPNRRVPTYLIDTNVRIDYGKLRHLLVVGRQLNGNFDLLRTIIGEQQVDVHVQPGFPLHELAEPENFLSLLHYFGLLSIREVVHGVPRLAIPNQTVKRLMYGYLRDGYKDVGVFRINLFRFEQLLMGMANESEWRPVLEFLSEAIARQTGIRDYIAGEKVIQGFLAAYLSVTDYFVFRSEAELGKGHADISLEPLLARYPHLRTGYLIELKYLARGEPADEGARGDGGRRSHGAVAPLPGGRAPGTAVPGRPVHGPGGGVPRLGDGVQRRGGVARRSRTGGDCMTDWSSCPAVERKPGKISGAVGVHRNTSTGIRSVRESRRRRHDRRVRGVVSGRRQATGACNTGT